MARKDRQDRISNIHNGSAGTSSTDFFHLVDRLHQLAKREADSLDANTSMYVWAALPMLLAALSATLVEQEVMLVYGPKRDAKRVEIVSKGQSLPEQFETLYGLSGQLLDDLRILVELRNEIIHPAHTPTGTPDNWPDSLRAFKQRGLLTSTGNPRGDYVMLSQMKSLRLLEWAMQVIESLRKLVLTHSGHPSWNP